MAVHILYQTSASATGGRDGRVIAADGRLDMALAMPKELGGDGGNGSNPEQLFAAAYAAGFLSALLFAASQGGPKLPSDARVTTFVGIGPSSQGGFGLDIRLDIELPGLSGAEAEVMVRRAHRLCPYSNAIRGNVLVRTMIS